MTIKGRKIKNLKTCENQKNYYILTIIILLSHLFELY